MTQRVLIIENDDCIRSLLAMILSDEGYLVRESSSGNEALTFLLQQSERYIVLLDLVMPIMTGNDFLRIALSHPLLSEQHRYVLMSANHELPTSFMRTLNDWHVPLLVKPFEIETVLKTLIVASDQLDKQKTEIISGNSPQTLRSSE